MNTYNKLLLSLDQCLGFPNKRDSRWKNRGQNFDQKTGEHVFWVEYRTRVNPGSAANKVTHRPGRMPMIRELLAVDNEAV